MREGESNLTRMVENGSVATPYIGPVYPSHQHTENHFNAKVLPRVSIIIVVSRTKIQFCCLLLCQFRSVYVKVKLNFLR